MCDHGEMTTLTHLNSVCVCVCVSNKWTELDIAGSVRCEQTSDAYLQAKKINVSLAFTILLIFDMLSISFVFVIVANAIVREACGRV